MIPGHAMMLSALSTILAALITISEISRILTDGQKIIGKNSQLQQSQKLNSLYQTGRLRIVEEGTKSGVEEGDTAHVLNNTETSMLILKQSDSNVEEALSEGFLQIDPRNPLVPLSSSLVLNGSEKESEESSGSHENTLPEFQTINSISSNVSEADVKTAENKTFFSNCDEEIFSRLNDATDPKEEPALGTVQMTVTLTVTSTLLAVSSVFIFVFIVQRCRERRRGDGSAIDEESFWLAVREPSRSVSYQMSRSNNGIPANGNFQNTMMKEILEKLQGVDVVLNSLEAKAPSTELKSPLYLTTFGSPGRRFSHSRSLDFEDAMCISSL